MSCACAASLLCYYVPACSLHQRQNTAPCRAKTVAAPVSVSKAGTTKPASAAKVRESPALYIDVEYGIYRHQNVHNCKSLEVADQISLTPQSILVVCVCSTPSAGLCQHVLDPVVSLVCCCRCHQASRARVSVIRTKAG